MNQIKQKERKPEMGNIKRLNANTFIMLLIDISSPFLTANEFYNPSVLVSMIVSDIYFTEEELKNRLLYVTFLRF